MLVNKEYIYLSDYFDSNTSFDTFNSVRYKYLWLKKHGYEAETRFICYQNTDRKIIYDLTYPIVSFKDGDKYLWIESFLPGHIGVHEYESECSLLGAACKAIDHFNRKKLTEQGINDVYFLDIFSYDGSDFIEDSRAYILKKVKNRREK